MYFEYKNRKILNNIEGSGPVILFKNSGHLPYLEQPTSFNMTVETFLNHALN